MRNQITAGNLTIKCSKIKWPTWKLQFYLCFPVSRGKIILVTAPLSSYWEWSEEMLVLIFHISRKWKDTLLQFRLPGKCIACIRLKERGEKEKEGVCKLHTEQRQKEIESLGKQRTRGHKAGKEGKERLSPGKGLRILTKQNVSKGIKERPTHRSNSLLSW